MADGHFTSKIAGGGSLSVQTQSTEGGSIQIMNILRLYLVGAENAQRNTTMLSPVTPATTAPLICQPIH
jgi:hypothetical protein